MSNSLYGVTAYQQTDRTLKNTRSASKADATKKNTSVKSSDPKEEKETIQTKQWRPIDTKSALVPSLQEGLGMTIGDVELSDSAKEYYEKLKAKFGNMEFIAVSKDMKSQVQANVAAYGNAKKQVVLIDDAKLEQMAADESYRKKYEGLIAMSQTQLQNVKASLTISGANIKNFGMSVGSDGKTDFFATLETSYDDQAKRIEKQKAKKQAQKAKEKKQAKKKAEETRFEKKKEARIKETERFEKNKKAEDAVTKASENKRYMELHSDSLELLSDQVARYAYENSARNILTDTERTLGQKFDFRG